MNLPFYIAKRYLFSKKSHNVINIISGIAMTGIGIGTLALIVVLSAFNGIENLVASLYSSFDPDIKITVKEGKTFDHAVFPEKEIREIEGVMHYTKALEETAMLKYKNNQTVAMVKGVEDDFEKMSGMDTMIHSGEFILKHEGRPFAVLGYGVADNLGVFMETALTPIRLYAAKRTGTAASISLAPEQALRQMNIHPSGIFVINPDFDFKYVLVPFSYAQELFDYTTEVSAVEIGLKKEGTEQEVKKKLMALLGSDFEVKTRYEQNEIIHKTNKTEKWITFMILSFILVIATFNVIGSLTMLIIDKKQDINILKSMGASSGMIKNVFLLEGMLISVVGGFSGLALGGLLCWLQQTVGLLRLEGVIVEYYPVQMQLFDFGAVFATVIFIGFIASWFPVRYVVKRYY